MAKSRRKADIRARAETQIAALSRPSRPSDWRLLFLEGIVDGASVTDAARIAGVSRARVYVERGEEEFDQAWARAESWRDMGFRNLARPIWPPHGTAICGNRLVSTQRRTTSFRL